MNKTDEHSLVPSLQFYAARALAQSNKKHAFLSSSNSDDLKSLVSNSDNLWSLHQTSFLIKQERRKLKSTTLTFFGPSRNDFLKFFNVGKALFVFLFILGGINHFLKFIDDYHQIRTAVVGLMVILTLGGPKILRKFVHFEGEEHFFESIKKLTQALQENIKMDLTELHIDEAERGQLQECCKTLSTTYNKHTALKAVESLDLIYDKALLALSSSNDRTGRPESENKLSL
jgi:hypothetical protein